MTKTCGNCGHGCYESTVYCEVTNNDILVSCEACDEWIESASQHRRCDRITQLEQRYQQLEEVARDMVDYLSKIKRKPSPLELTIDTQKFRKALEELGVEL